MAAGHSNGEMAAAAAIAAAAALPATHQFEFQEHEILWGKTAANSCRCLRRHFPGAGIPKPPSGLRSFIPRRIPSAPIDIPGSRTLRPPYSRRNRLDDFFVGAPRIKSEFLRYSDEDDEEEKQKEDEEKEEDEDGEEENEEEIMVPPHVFLQKRYARRRVMSYSMCEGIGRTLKGRDLSNVRNAILYKTGFLEDPPTK
ncbi:uncharacterized protein LOC127247935 [Andrographis paniculata]|uniref:uncharacterized protein LOC127247935 n=1 Tax=Andrographis paniculata TaxID=175694 RepID=UPI0021E7EE39|nr:uncharacterized protein LOC127247935 [Andrographis paniculata]